MSAGQQRLTELSRQQPLRLLVQGPQVDEHPRTRCPRRSWW
jgi:hypothetical protein